MPNHVFDAVTAAAPPGTSFIREESGHTWTYGEMFDASSRLAFALAEHGVRMGDRVAVQVEKSPIALALYLACLRAGAVYLPLNDAYTAAEVAYFVEDATPRLLVVSPRSVEALTPLAERHEASLATMDRDGQGSLWKSARRFGHDFPPAPRRADDLAAVLYTSGTTGRSKGAMLTHGNLRSNAETLRDLWEFSAADRLIHALPIFHTHGLFVASNVVLLSGASMLWMPKFDVDRVIDHFAEASVLMGIPTFYTRLLQSERLDRRVTRKMRLFVSGSAPLLPDTHAAFLARTGHAILERYGMTETGMNTSNPVRGRKIAGTVGLPLPGVDVRIGDPADGTPLPSGHVGMIEVRGPNVCKGYWKMPDKTLTEFRADGFFITGDLGRIDADGYVSIVGREKDLVITGGLNVYPSEVESEINAIPGVVESAVVGVPHPDLGECVVAMVVASEASSLNEGGILQYLGERLARFKLPKRIAFADELPRNSMGKVQKNLIRRDITWSTA